MCPLDLGGESMMDSNCQVLSANDVERCIYLAWALEQRGDIESARRWKNAANCWAGREVHSCSTCPFENQQGRQHDSQHVKLRADADRRQG